MAMQRWVSLFLRYRYLAICIVLVVLMVSQTMNGQWFYDFWVHSAVIHELANSPLAPRHAQLSLNAPHSDYSPYSLFIALASRVTGLDAITALSIAGIFNLLLFLFGLRLFISRLFPELAEATAFYALLFTLLLWGKDAWQYSGFFNLQVLGLVLPYSSTFAPAVVFITLSVYLSLMRSGNRLLYLPIFAAIVIVILSHPLSFILLCIGLVSISLGEKNRSLSDYAMLFLVLVLGVLVAVLWPYYPLVTLVLSGSNVYDEANFPMYLSVTQRILPAVVGVALVSLKIRTNWSRSLGLMLVFLLLIYGYGAVSEKWSYGRAISFIVLILHISLAAGIAQAESMLRWGRLPISVQKLAYSLVISTITVMWSFDSSIMPALARSAPGQSNNYSQYLFLKDYVKQYDVVLSDMETSWFVPTFGGKVISAGLPLAFVPDQKERTNDVYRFFSDVTFDDRAKIIQKYGVNFLLVSKPFVPMWKEFIQSFQSSGHVVFDNDEFVLFSFRSTGFRANPGTGQDEQYGLLVCVAEPRLTQGSRE